MLRRRLVSHRTITTSLSVLLYSLCLVLAANVFTVTRARSTSSSAALRSKAGLLEAIPTTIYLPVIHRAPDVSWPMAGANPKRTSWSAEEVRGDLEAAWFKPFEPYILPRVQIIADHGLLFISTARGLYALNAATGAEQWVYPTELPLGNSPTIYKNIAFVGGMDHKIHAINADTGQGLWTFSAQAGFDTNPLIVDDVLYAGNRDGTFYAIRAVGANAGTELWSFSTGGPIHYSAAYHNGVVYFASNDSHAYALDAQTGSLVWKSAKLPGQGFHSWWPVIHGQYVIFAGSHNYIAGQYLGAQSLHELDLSTVYPNHDSMPTGTLVGQIGKAAGAWVPGTPTIDTSKSSGGSLPVTEYFEQYPWRRTYFVLNLSNGAEYSTDFDNDGKAEYAPMLWFGAKGSGNRYPPIVAGDGVLYQTNNFMSDSAIAGGQVSGWTPGTPYISAIISDWGAVDEPHAYSAGGDLIYWSLCCDRQAGSVDIKVPNALFYDNYVSGILPPTSGGDHSREWGYYGYNLASLLPGYDAQYYQVPSDVFDVFGDSNGMYGSHGDQNAPIPYKGRVYIHRSNAILAFEPGNPTAQALPIAQTVDVQDAVPVPSDQELKDRLTEQVEAILAAGHLRPGWATTGLFDFRGAATCGDNLTDYFHHPADTLYTLLRALPHLSPGLQQQTRTYIQNEYNAYPPYDYNHIGWQDGAAREFFDIPPELESGMSSHGPETFISNHEPWGFNPQFFYTLWKYAEEFGGATAIFNASNNKLPALPSASVLAEMPHAHNAFIAGYLGYLELEALAGFPPTAAVQNDLDYLLSLRAGNFTEDTAPIYLQQFQKYYCRTMNAARNFMYLVPELADYLRTNPGAFSKVQQTLDTYEDLAPYWFVSRVEAVIGEGILAPLYDTHAVLHARAWILQEPRSELAKYLDAPAFAVGDLFYIDNLITVLEAPN